LITGLRIYHLQPPKQAFLSTPQPGRKAVKLLKNSKTKSEITVFSTGKNAPPVAFLTTKTATTGLTGSLQQQQK
jgi:hypothetical protein